MTAEHTTTCFGEKFGVQADFAQASDTIRTLDAEGNWVATQYQVADFRHSPITALRRTIENCVRAGGDDPADYTDEIKAALALTEKGE
jgi:hypothetical protein